MASGSIMQPVSGIEEYNISATRDTNYVNTLGYFLRYGRLVTWSMGLVTVSQEIPMYKNLLTTPFPERFRPLKPVVLIVKQFNVNKTVVFYVDTEGKISTEDVVPAGPYYGNVSWLV